LSNTLEVDFCLEALEEALSKGRPEIFNTDQGSQFTSDAFTGRLLAQGIPVSMDGKGRCMDNVFVERLWRSIKYEEVYLKAYQNGTEARRGIGAYLAFYNQERPHQALGYQTPGQVFQAVSPARCLLKHAGALSSLTGTGDVRAVGSLILASSLS
jgi:putative transposase